MKMLNCKSAWKDLETGVSAVQKFVFIFILVNDETGYLNLIFPLLNFSAHVSSAIPLQKSLGPAKGLSHFLVLWLTTENQKIYALRCLWKAMGRSTLGWLPGGSRMAVACLCLCLVWPTAMSQNEMVIDSGSDRLFPAGRDPAAW